MRKVIFLVSIISFYALIISAQVQVQDFEDFPDQYNDILTDLTFDYFYEPPDGEYQLVLGQFPWGWDDFQTQNSNHLSPFIDFPKSVKIELVSFPFVPDCLPNCYQTGPVVHYRNFESLDMDDATYTFYLNIGEADEIEGQGIVHEGFNIFTTTERHLLDDPSYYEGYPTSLMSLKYVNPCSNTKMLLPHSIFKYTLYIHEENNSENIVDQVSWILDNTRGRMKFYPFSNTNEHLTTDKDQYDVTIFPQMHHYESWNENHYYNSSDNDDWYISPEALLDNGSIDYFPVSDIINSPYYLESYFYPADPSIETYSNQTPYIHPAQYCIVNPTIRNSTGKAYAGYDDGGDLPPDPQSSLELGLEHTYSIDVSFSLDLINPEEKIIYNPSVCTVNTVITFPQDYKFLSPHGKPVDKATVEYYKDIYWPERGYNFTDYRDVPVEYPDGTPWSEYYVKGGKEVIIEQSVIIMNVEFTGPTTGTKGKIRYYPDQTFGNFTISPELKLIILTDNLEIEDSKTWENETSFLGSVINIEDGATLTIKQPLAMNPDAKIIVKRGGKLIVDGGILTSTGSELWKGVEVHGTSTAAQNVSDQGWVQIINGGTISNAEVGIKTIKYDDSGGVGGYDFNYTGGIVQCNDANFINNNQAVYFYKYPASPYSYTSQSNFSECTFETNDLYLIQAPDPSYFVRIFETNGVDFLNCSFTNESSTEDNGRGIYTYKSDYSIKGSCNSTISPCPVNSWDYSEFKNLEYGIYSVDITSTRNLELDHVLFDNNFRGVYISGVTEPIVTYCDFEINSAYSPTGGYGLYLNNSTGYEIEENEFYHNTSTETGIGLIVNNSGFYNNEIYRNNFTGLKQGISCQERNRNIGGEGLQLLCNIFDDCHKDILVPRPSSTSYGIASNQGALNNPINSEDMAGNDFFYNTVNDDDDDLENYGTGFNYYYANDISASNVEPKENTPTVTPYGVDISWEYEDDCSSNQSSSGGGGRSAMQTMMVNTQDDIIGVEATLAELVDGGNTVELNLEVETSLPPEAAAVYNDLLDESPYLSSTVVESTIEKDNVLPNAMVRDVMVANPHSAKSDVLMEKLDERSTPVPDYMKGQILQGRSTVSMKEKLESELSMLKLKKSQYLKKLIRSYLDDFDNWEQASDSILVILQNNEDLASKYPLAMLHLERDDYILGENVLINIPINYSLNLDQQAEHQNWTDFYEFLSDVKSTNLSIQQLTEDQKQTLTDIMNLEAGIASSWARDYLLTLGELDYQEPIQMADELKSAQIKKEFDDLINTPVPQMLSVHPNPTRDYVILSYNLEMEQGGEIQIRDVQGNLLKTVEVFNKQDQITIMIEDWKPGTYIVTLMLGEKKVESIKFTLLK